MNIFQKIKKFRGVSSSVSSRIDSEVGADNIANHFATIYRELYNRVELGDKIQEISSDIENEVDYHGQLQLDRINEELISKVLKMLKPNKCDALFDTMSDFYIHSPPDLVTHLTALVKLYFSHGTVPNFILICTLIPLSEGKFR